MANPEHLEILQQGVDHWNQWRKTKPNLKPDLRCVDLSETNLRGVDLRWAYLINTNLSGANLSGANLGWVDLFGANLRGALLFDANLDGADLSDADLSGATLFGTNLKETNFNETKFLNLLLGGTVFVNVDLSQVEGLETCVHRGPSSVDHRTLIRSGKLPDVFLKGCGFPDQFIDYLPSLLGSLDPIQFYSCFISHSVKDEEFAKQLYSDLDAEGIRCWYAPEDLKIGAEIRDGIHEAIRIHDKLLIVLSQNSIESVWVKEEVEIALQNETKRKKNGDENLILFPIRLDDAVMDSDQAWAAKVRTRNIGDFRNWKDHDSRKKAFKRLLRDLKNESNNDKSKP